MPPRRSRLSVVVIVLVLTALGGSQVSQPQQQSSPIAKNTSSEPVSTFQANTRMVTIEVVAKDRRGRHITGLKASDFEVFEQSGGQKDKRKQKIAAFQEIQFAELAAKGGAQMQVPAGVFTNVVTLQRNPMPPTILMLDGLNTKLEHQAQIHAQTLRISKAIPSNVPVAVFLLGRRCVRVLQDFTTDHDLLQAALEKANSTAGTGLGLIHPVDDPTQVSAQFEKLGNLSGGGSDPSGSAIRAQIAGMAALASEVEVQHLYRSQIDRRVYETTQAFISIGRHVAGYPGRKNLLWVSSAFPVHLTALFLQAVAGVHDPDPAYRNYSGEIQEAANVLSDAKVAVYPINPAGVQPHALFEAATVPRDYSAEGTADTLNREITLNAYQDNAMQVIADGTGGEVCTGNDLGDCVRQAVDDSSSFYEIAYYPDSQSWKGEYRKVIVRTRQSGSHLAYREGYFARSEEGNPEGQKAALQDACADYLNATSMFLAATTLPPDSPDQLKFYLMINASALTFVPGSDGGRDLNIAVAVCTFDKTGKQLQWMRDPIHRTFDTKQYESLIAAGGLPHVVSVPGPKPDGLRLLVMDVPTGRVGSVFINGEESAVAAPAPVAETVSQKRATAH